MEPSEKRPSRTKQASQTTAEKPKPSEPINPQVYVPEAWREKRLPPQLLPCPTCKHPCDRYGPYCPRCGRVDEWKMFATILRVALVPVAIGLLLVVCFGLLIALLALFSRG